MQRKALLVTFISIFLTIFSNNLVAVEGSYPAEQKVTNAAREIADQYHQMGWFSGSVLITKDNKTIISEAFGFQDLDQKRKNSLHTRYNLGSIMKDFTKVLVLQQVQAGKLSLEDKLSRFQLGFKQKYAEQITIQQLLDHRSGFRDIFVAEYRENALSFDTLAKKLGLLIDLPLLFEPGTDQKYSNYGYVVLGVILEKVTGKPFQNLLKENIFAPVEMKSTTFFPIENHPHQSTRYSYRYDNSLQEVGVTEHPSPDGGIESTVTDLQKFYRALFYSNTLLSNTNSLNRKSFAMDGTHWGSYGGGRGVSSAVEIDLANGYEIVVLANTDNLIAERISGRILSFIKTGEYAPIKQLEKNFAFSFYQQNGGFNSKQDFRNVYKINGYDRFIGRTLNELGMELLRSQSWEPAFDVFEYLASLFPEAPQVYDSLAFAYLTKGDKDKANRLFTKSLLLNASFKSDYVSDNYGHGN